MRKIELGNVLQLHRGYDLPNAKRVPDDVPVISSSGISGSHNTSKCDGPNVITGRYGTIGEVYYYDGPCWPLNTTLYVSDFKGNDPKYVYYLLKCALKRLMFGEGNDKSTVPGVDRNVLHMLQVPFEPSIKKQRTISSLLSTIDEKIETNTRIIAELESLARTIYDYWFTQFDFPDKHGNPYRSSGGPMVYSELLNCNIPSGWIIKPLGNSAQQCTEGITPNHYPDKTFEYYSIPDFDAAGAPSHMLGKDIQSGKYKITSKDLLLSKLNPQFPRLWDPFCNSSDSICSTEFIVLRPLIDFDKPWFWSVLGSKKFQAFMISNAVSSTGSRSRIHPETVLAYLIPLPPEPIRKQYANKIDPILLSMKKAKQETILLTSLRNWLLPLLMNGQAIIDK